MIKQGFTMIELVIATAILLSLVGFGTSSYINFNERQILEQAGKTLKNNLRLAQQNAITGVKDEGLCNPSGTENRTLTGWCMSPVDAATYRWYGVCDDNEADGNEPATFPVTINDIEFPQGVTLDVRAFQGNTPAGAPATSLEDSRLRFNVFGAGVETVEETPGNPFDGVAYCLTGTFPSLAGGQNQYLITVRSSGEIIDEGFTASCF